jgi:hypothetical protein
VDIFWLPLERDTTGKLSVQYKHGENGGVEFQVGKERV